MQIFMPPNLARLILEPQVNFHACESCRGAKMLHETLYFIHFVGVLDMMASFGLLLLRTSIRSVAHSCVEI